MDDGRDEHDEERTDDGNQRTPEWPLETAHLAKGDRIPAADIERGWSTSRTHRKYGLKLMAAAEFVTMRLRERGLIVVTKSEHDDLLILTDEAAAADTTRNFKLGIQKMATALGKKQTIDRSGLGIDAVAEHDRELTKFGFVLQATRKEMRQTPALPGPTARQTPGLKGGDK